MALTEIIILPVTPAVYIGLGTQLQAVGVYDDGSQVDITLTAAWASSNTLHATVGAATGICVGVGGGFAAKITASLGGFVGSVIVVASHAVPPVIADSYHEINVANMDTLTAVQFGYNSMSQAVINEAPYSVDYSWDGVNVATVGAAGSSTAAIGFQDHQRSIIYVKRHAGTGGAAAYFKIWTSAS